MLHRGCFLMMPAPSGAGFLDEIGNHSARFDDEGTPALVLTVKHWIPGEEGPFASRSDAVLATRMLSRFDDYPIHQTPEPLAHVATSDRNAYDRYWFNGYADDGEFYFGIGMAIYPNLGVLDCGFSIVHDGEQHAFHASRRAPRDPSET